MYPQDHQMYSSSKNAQNTACRERPSSIFCGTLESKNMSRFYRLCVCLLCPSLPSFCLWLSCKFTGNSRFYNPCNHLSLILVPLGSQSWHWDIPYEWRFSSLGKLSKDWGAFPASHVSHVWSLEDPEVAHKPLVTLISALT